MKEKVLTSRGITAHTHTKSTDWPIKKEIQRNGFLSFFLYYVRRRIVVVTVVYSV